MKKRYYLAYGSNLNMDQMVSRCPGSRRVGTATIEDYQLLFKGSRTGSYLTIEEKDGGVVPVGVWEVTEEDEKALDRYEGCPMFYYKDEVTIRMWDERRKRFREVNAFIYIMHEARKPGIPTPRYMRTCLIGYDDFRFDHHFLLDAQARAYDTQEKAFAAGRRAV